MERKSPDKAEEPSTKFLVFDLTKSLIWPVISLVALILFYAPIRQTLDSLALQSGHLQTIRIGAIEMNVRPEDLPLASPPSEIAGALHEIAEQDIDLLLRYAGPVSACPQLTPNISSYDHLLKLNLLVTRGHPLILPPDASAPKGCGRAAELLLTGAGSQTRDFILRLVEQQIAKK